MLDGLSTWIYRNSSGRVALLATVIFLVFTATVLPGQAARAEESSGGAGAPDTSFWYSAQDLRRYAEAYGEQGRADYVQARFTFDLIWPLVYAAFLTTAISWSFRSATGESSNWQLANLAPLYGLALDYLENLSTSVFMLRFPQDTPLIGSLAPIFTAAKWIFVGASFLLLLVGLWMAIAKRWSRR